MKKLLHTCCLFLVLLCCTQEIVAQVKFETKVSKTSLGVNERLRVDFTMNVNGDYFEAPNFEGFQVIQGPSVQRSQEWNSITRKSTFNLTYSYHLIPTRQGKVTIGGASMEYEGDTYKSNSVTINVTQAVEKPKDPNDHSIDLNDALHLVAEVSKTNPYINEPITVVYKLYFSPKIGITDTRILEKPKYNNFWSQEIKIDRLKAEEGSYNGERFRYVILRKVVLYPQVSGNLDIEPLSMDIDVRVPTNRVDFFGRVLETASHKRVSTSSRSIRVKPLPENGKPSNFSGAVGQFSFVATPNRNLVRHGENIELDVKVEGKGNLKLFTLPKPTIPASLEMYDPIKRENINVTLSGMNGWVSEKYTIIPQYKGNYTINPLEFNYFDPSSGKYKTLQSQEFILQVVDGPEGDNSTFTQNSNSTNTAPQTIGDQMSFIQLKTKLAPMQTQGFFGSTLFYILCLLPFIMIPLIIILRKKQLALANDIDGNRIRQSNRLTKKYLSEAKTHINDKNLFYESLERSIHNFLKAKLHIETSDLSKDRIQEMLMQRNVSESLANDFIHLIQSCEMARYTPSTSQTMQQDYDKAVGLINSMEKVLNS